MSLEFPAGIFYSFMVNQENKAKKIGFLVKDILASLVEDVINMPLPDIEHKGFRGGLLP